MSHFSVAVDPVAEIPQRLINGFPLRNTWVVVARERSSPMMLVLVDPVVRALNPFPKGLKQNIRECEQDQEGRYVPHESELDNLDCERLR